MRDNPYPEYIPKWTITLHNYFYSISQVFATMNILTCKDIDKIFLLLIPIQTAPFGMTLVKKGIIDQSGWHVYYTIALLINYLSVPHTILIPNKLYWILSLIFSLLRFKYRVNKYILWSLIISYQVFYVLKKYNMLPSSSLININDTFMLNIN